MNAVTDLFDALDRAVADGPATVVVSVLIVAGVVGARYVSRRWLASDRARSREGSRARVAVSGAITLVSGLGVLALVGIWGLLEPLGAAYRQLGLGSLGGELVLVAVLLGAAYSLTGFVGRVIEEFAGTRMQISEHQREIVYRLTQAGLYTVVGLTIVTLFTDDIGSLLVGAGFLGIVVGMAARQTLGAMLAGFVLMFSRPFEIGDWVEIGDNEGIVTKITIVNTRLQTFDGEHVILPNDQVSSQAILNRTRRGRLRVEVEVGVDYGVRPKRAADVAVEAVDGLDAVSTVPTPQVVVKRFADSSVVLGVRVWIDDPSARRRWRAKTAVIDAVHEAFDREGIEIPFPQRTLSEREGEVLAEADGEAAGVAAADGGEDAP
ncbi:MAG: mechanosensitive ion channel family protein [Haloferacaceae archaeon]